MKYFTKAKSLDEAKAEYKKLAMENHPDKGGETAVMQDINNDFEAVFKFLKHTAKTVNTETATGYRTNFYTENGWEGERFDPSLRAKDIGSIMRDYVKFVYPNFKFSIRSTYNTINIKIMEAPVNMFIETKDVPEILDGYGPTKEQYIESIERKEKTVNHYYIDRDFLITDYAKSVFTDIHQMLNSYNRDDSDSMTDYFDTNFYETLGIGSWDKPFQIVEKIARITPTKESGKARIA